MVRGSSLGFALCLAFAPWAPVRAEEAKPPPGPAAPTAPAKEAPEPPLEGAAKKAYDDEYGRVLEGLRGDRNRETLRARLDRLGGALTRASRDALIAFTRAQKNQEVVSWCFSALAGRPDAVVIAFLGGPDGLCSKDFLVQQSAAKTLGRARSPRAVEPILTALLDASMKIEVLNAAVLALAKSGPRDPRVVERVLLLAEDKRDTVRAGAYEAIGYLDAKDAHRRLLTALEEEKNTRARAAAATGLGWTLRKDVIPALEKAIASDKSLTIKSAASEAITVIQNGKRPE